MIERTQRTDPTAGRLDALQFALRMWEDSPLFGYGYNAGVQVDNFVAKYITETGLVGLCLYFFFLISLLVISIRTYKRTTSADVRYIAMLSIAFNAFVFFRSFAEATDIFHLSDIMSNAAFFWSGMTVAGAGTLALTQKSTVSSIDRLTTAPQSKGPSAIQLPDPDPSPQN